VLFLVHEAYSLWAQTFRETTGMSKATFNGLVEEARASGLFIDELLVGIRRPKPIALEKKFLMSILKIRQGCSFDSFGLCLGISKAVSSTFFHKFCAWFSSPAKYGEYVYMPRTVEERDDIEGVYRKMGLPGCVGSMDGVKFPSLRIPDEARWAAQNGRYDGRKFVVNVTTLYNGMVQYSTPLFFGNISDSAMLPWDELNRRLNDPADFFFNTPVPLKDALGNDVIEHGNYVLCDGGYPKDQSKINPGKSASRNDQQPIGAFSARIETKRKEVENLFGRLKRQFKPFSHGVEFDDVLKVENMWRTALVLHNLQIMENGYDTIGHQEDDYEGPFTKLAEHVVGEDIQRSIDLARENLQPNEASVVEQLQVNPTDAQRVRRHAQKRMRLAQNYFYRDWDKSIYNLKERANLFEPPLN